LIRQAFTETEIVEALRPVLEGFLARRTSAMENIERTIRKGKFDTSYSSDGQWFTVEWFPPADLGRTRSGS